MARKSNNTKTNTKQYKLVQKLLPQTQTAMYYVLNEHNKVVSQIETINDDKVKYNAINNMMIKYNIKDVNL